MENFPQKSVLYFVVSLFLTALSVTFFWFLLWKFILEPNPVVREFFDLDVGKNPIKKKA